MSINLQTFGDHSEQYGANVASAMLDAVLNSADQAEAVRAVLHGLEEAFNLQDDPIKARIAAGFAVSIVNVIGIGLANLPRDKEADHAPA
jgi:hypothetical protein